jgi:hypothetical protein
MTEKTVPDAWTQFAAELRRIAADAEKLVGSPAPLYLNLSIHPFTPRSTDRANPEARAETVAAVDEVAIALLGRPAATRKMGSGAFHHTISGNRGPIGISILQEVADPAAVDKDAEPERLRAELESRGLLYQREANDPTPVSPARGGEVHVGGVRDGGQLVDETPAPVHLGGFPGTREAREAEKQSIQTGYRDLLAANSYSSPVAWDILHGQALAEDHNRLVRAVEQTMTPQDAGRVANPKLARFLAEKEDARRSTESVHCLDFGSDGDEDDRLTCGKQVRKVSQYTDDFAKVTCSVCIRAMAPVSESR